MWVEMEKILKKLHDFPNKPLEEIFLQAAKNGEARVLFCDEEGRLQQLTVTQDSCFSRFIKDAKLGSFLREEKLIDGDAKTAVFDKSGENLLKKALEAHGEKKAFVDLGPDVGNVTVQLQIRDDGVVCVEYGEILGKGSSKTVQKVHAFGTKKDVFVRAVLHRQGDVTKKTLEREYARLQQFSHPNIVKVEAMRRSQIPVWDEHLKQFSVQEQAFLQTEFCDKGTCEILEEGPPKTVEEWKEKSFAILDAACGLKYIHERGMAVMDFKPVNLFRKTENGKVVTKLGDFEPRKIGEKSAAITGPFADFEALCDLKTSTKSDVWALGISIYNMAYGYRQNPMAYVETKEQFEKQYPLLVERLETDTDPKHSKMNELLLKIFTRNREKRPDLTDDFMRKLQEILDSFW